MLTHTLTNVQPVDLDFYFTTLHAYLLVLLVPIPNQDFAQPVIPIALIVLISLIVTNVNPVIISTLIVVF